MSGRPRRSVAVVNYDEELDEEHAEIEEEHGAADIVAAQPLALPKVSIRARCVCSASAQPAHPAHLARAASLEQKRARERERARARAQGTNRARHPPARAWT